MTDFIESSGQGRWFEVSRRVQLGDAGADGVLRLDGVARFLQDVANDDWVDTGVRSDDVWVVRRTAVRRASTKPWPSLGDEVTLRTWCAGVGAAWAERRTNLSVAGDVVIEATALWVPIGPEGRPRRLSPEFFAHYGEASAGRKVPGRVPDAVVATNASRRVWPLRRSDLDVVGHVNNAAVWNVMSEFATSETIEATVVHHGPLEGDDEVTLATTAGAWWLVVGDEVRVAGSFTPR